ncbi:MAG: AEC family transporter [Oscillospiraceae bacterium]|nr:AEC family transporter [Oscillospiraceae bacterium]
MAQIVLHQAVSMFLLILVGAGCFKLHLLSKETVSQISGLVLKVVNPVVIFMAYQREFQAELVRNLGWTFLLSVIAYAIAMAVSYLCIREKEGRETVIERFSCIYSNCGFMGIPLVKSMFDYEGVFYLTAFLTVFNALVWSHGVMQMSGEKSLKSLGKILRSPAIIAIILGMLFFFVQISLPDVLSETLDSLGNLNTPLAMIVAGATIVQTNLLKTFRKPRVFYISLIKLILIPVLITGIFMLIPGEKIVEMTVVAAMAAPSAAICTMQCLNYNRNAAYASELFGVTTLFSIATMPLMMILYELTMKL